MHISTAYVCVRACSMFWRHTNRTHTLYQSIGNHITRLTHTHRSTGTLLNTSSAPWYLMWSLSLISHVAVGDAPSRQGRFWGGGANSGQCPRNSESGPPCGPPDRESASIIQWQISCNDFVLKGKAEIKCLSSTLSEWGIFLFFFPGCMCPLTKNQAPTWPPY